MPTNYNGQQVSFFKGSDNLIVITGLQIHGNTTYESTATVTGQLKTEASETSVGDSITFSYVSGSDGEYRGTLPSTVSMTIGDTYILDVTLTAGSGEKAVLRLIGPAVYLGS